MMAAIYVDNLVRLRSDSFRGIAGRGAAKQTSSVTFVILSATSNVSVPSASSTSSRKMDEYVSVVTFYGINWLNLA